MSLLEETIAKVAVPDPAIAAQAQAHLDGLTKPRRSLGRIEDLACRIALARGRALPEIPEKVLVVMAADHGVAEEGVSAYPQEVTGQMLLNFARGGAAINALARHAGARLMVVDMGTRHVPPGLDGVRRYPIGPGTRNMVREPAMTSTEARQALEVGIVISAELAASGCTMVGLGEMGIGNTTSAAALCAAFTGASVEESTGRGTGVDDAGYRRKVEAVRAALARHPPAGRPPLAVLAALGGFEIAGLAGLVLGASAARIPVVMDGFITGAAALAAARLCPAVRDYLVAAHRSVETGHRFVLEDLGTEPLLALDMRLGEGSGAALAMGLADAAVRLMHEMATFGAAGVTDTGR